MKYITLAIFKNTKMEEEGGNKRLDTHTEKREWSFPFYLEVSVLLYSMGYWPIYVTTVLYIYSRLVQGSSLAANVTYSSLDYMGDGSTCTDVSNNASGTADGSHATLELELELAVKAEAAAWQMYIMMALYIPGIIVIPVIGVFSDRAGRKPLMLVPVVGGLMRGLGYVVVDAYKLDIVYLIIPSLLEGCTGYLMGYSCVFFAYLADITSTEKRTQRFVILNSMYCLAGALCMMFSGNLVELLGFYRIFWIVSGIYAVTILFIIFFVPQHIPGCDHNQSEGLCTMLLHMVMVFKLYLKQRPDPNQRLRLNLLVATLLLTSLVIDGNVVLETLYLIGVPYCLSAVWVGYFNGIVAVVGAVGAVLVVWVLRFCLSDIPLTAVAALTTFASFVLQAFTTNTLLLSVGFPILYILGVASPTLIRACMSKNVQPEEQGALQASLSIVNALGQVCSSAVLIQVYLATLTTFNGFVFLFCALVQLVIVAILMFVYVLSPPASVQSREPLLQSGSNSYDSTHRGRS